MNFLLTLAVLAPACVLLAFVLWRHRSKSSPRDLPIVGCLASVTEPLDPDGAVIVRGELWRARVAAGGTPVACGELNVRVVGARGHLLEVEPRERE